MILYYSPGVCSQSVHITLNEAGIEHTLESVDLETKTTASGGDYGKINPLGYVPALELDNGEVLLEAPAILQYLADLKPEANLAPVNGTLARVRLQEQLNYTASELHKSFGAFFASVKPEGELLELALTKLTKRFDSLEKRLSDSRPYVMGDDFTVADAYTFVVASWAKIIDFDLGAYPQVRAYVTRVSNRPAVQATLKAEGLV